MWSIIPSLDALLQALAVAFTEPSFQTHRDLFLGWIMCIGKRTEYRVFQTIHASSVVSRVEHHPFDRFYNFFSRMRLDRGVLGPPGRCGDRPVLNSTGPLYLVVDDTLLHKTRPEGLRLGLVPRRGRLHRQASRHGLGEQLGGHGAGHPDPVVPRADPLSAAVGPLALARAANPSGVDLAAEMLAEVLRWFPDRQIVLIGDGGYAGPRLARGLGPAGSVRGADLAATRRSTIRRCRPSPLASAAASRRRHPDRPAGEVASRADRNRDGQEPGRGGHRGDRLWGDPDDVQSEQTGDGDREPAALVPGEYREAGTVGVADAERGQSVDLTVGHAVPEAESARWNLAPWDTEWSLGHWVARPPGCDHGRDN